MEEHAHTSYIWIFAHYLGYVTSHSKLSMKAHINSTINPVSAHNILTNHNFFGHVHAYLSEKNHISSSFGFKNLQWPSLESSQKANSMMIENS